jgi:hypothetical protein
MALALMCCGLVVALTGRAHADVDPGVANARFTSPGVRVFDEDAIGIGCTVFGYCDAADTAHVSTDAATRKRSERAGEPVIAECVVNDLVRVHTFSAASGAGADDLLTGWVSARGIQFTDPHSPTASQSC